MSTKSDSVSRFYLSETDAVPFEARQKLIAELHEDAKQQASQVLKEAKRHETISDQYTVEMEKLFGKEKYERFRQYVLKQRAGLQKETTPAPGLSISSHEKKDLYEKRDQRVRSYLKRQGVSEAEMKKIAVRYRKRFAKADDKGLPPKAKPVPLVLSSDVPKDILKAKTNPWILEEPPFANWHRHLRWNTSGFNASLNPVHDHITGHIYNAPLLSTAWPPGDNDWGAANMDLELGFWYRTQHDGRIEVWIASETTYVYHKLNIWDYWGWSDSYVSQDHYLTLRTGGSSARSFARMSWHWWDGYTDVHEVIYHLPANGTYWAHLFTTESFLANTWVFVWVGSRTHNYCQADDVQVDSFPVAHWYIKRVYVD